MPKNIKPRAAGDAAQAPWPVLPLTVDGHEFADPESNLAGDGKFPPFYVFDQNAQRNIAGPFDTREEAARVARACNAFEPMRDALESLKPVPLPGMIFDKVDKARALANATP